MCPIRPLLSTSTHLLQFSCFLFYLLALVILGSQWPKYLRGSLKGGQIYLAHIFREFSASLMNNKQLTSWQSLLVDRKEWEREKHGLNMTFKDRPLSDLFPPASLHLLKFTQSPKKSTISWAPSIQTLDLWKTFHIQTITKIFSSQHSSKFSFLSFPYSLTFYSYPHCCNHDSNNRLIIAWKFKVLLVIYLY
jgi:hypothetical protein